MYVNVGGAPADNACPSIADSSAGLLAFFLITHAVKDLMFTTVSKKLALLKLIPVMGSLLVMC